MANRSRKALFGLFEGGKAKRLAAAYQAANVGKNIGRITALGSVMFNDDETIVNETIAKKWNSKKIKSAVVNMQRQAALMESLFKILSSSIPSAKIAAAKPQRMTFPKATLSGQYFNSGAQEALIKLSHGVASLKIIHGRVVNAIKGGKYSEISRQVQFLKFSIDVVKRETLADFHLCLSVASG